MLYQHKRRLLEHLAVGPLVLLARNLNGLVPCPLVVDKLAVLGLRGVELGELVAVDIGGDVESGESLLSADEEGTLDDRVVRLAVDRRSTEQVLAAGLETGEETTDEVGRHEGEGELVVVLVVNLVQRVLLKVGVLPEPGKGDLAGLLVGVLALQLVEDKSGAGKSLKGVLGLGGGGGLLLLLNLFGLGGSLGLLGLGGGLLLGGNVLDGLLDELELGGNSRVAGGVVNGLVPTGDVGVLSTELLVEEVLEAAGEDAGGKQVGKSQTLTNEVGVGKEVLLEDVDGLEGSLGGVVNVLLVVGVAAEDGAEPAAKGTKDLGVGEREPLEDGGVVLLGLAEKAGLLVLGSNCARSASESPGGWQSESKGK